MSGLRKHEIRSAISEALDQAGLKGSVHMSGRPAALNILVGTEVRQFRFRSGLSQHELKQILEAIEAKAAEVMQRRAMREAAE